MPKKKRQGAEPTCCGVSSLRSGSCLTGQVQTDKNRYYTTDLHMYAQVSVMANISQKKKKREWTRMAEGMGTYGNVPGLVIKEDKDGKTKKAQKAKDAKDGKTTEGSSAGAAGSSAPPAPWLHDYSAELEADVSQFLGKHVT